MSVRAVAGGSLVSVHVKPRSRPSVVREPGRIVVRVASAPVEGRATEDARKLLANALGVPPRTVSLHKGMTSRAKVFRIEGLSPEEIEARLS